MRWSTERRPFEDRPSAGRELGALVRRRMPRGDVLVLGLPRGGLPVAAPVAEALGAPLDVLVVRKLGVPGSPELAMGAVASVAGGVVTVRNDDVLGRAFPTRERAQEAIATAAAAQGAELNRRLATYRGARPPLDVGGRVVVLVDDGLATGATARAAIGAARGAGAARVVVAAPVALEGALEVVEPLADDLIAVWMPRFFSVGQAYLDFTQTSDDEVRGLLSARAGDQQG
jgi:putative phosphoribosyl transferase